MIMLRSTHEFIVDGLRSVIQMERKRADKLREELDDKSNQVIILQNEKQLLHQKYEQAVSALGIKGALENFQEQLKNPHENP